MKTALTTMVLCLLASSASAQVLLKGGRVVTVSGEVLENASVLLGAEGKIEAVDTVIIAPPNYTTVDCEGKTITPGLIDVSTRLGLADIWAVRGSRDADPGFKNDLIRAAFRAADAFNPNAVAVPVTRTGGVTSTVVLPSGGLVSGQAAWVDLYHPTLFATVVDPYVAMFAQAGEDAAQATGGSRGGTILTLRELYDDVRFFDKNQSKFNENRSRTLTASRLDLAALKPTMGGDLPTFFEVDRASDILAVLALAKEQKLKPVILGGAEAWMVAKELAEAKVAVVVNAWTNLPYHFESLGAREDNATLLQKAGVMVVLSSFESHNVRLLRQYAGNAVRAGLKHEDALRAVTLDAAKLVGKDAEYGSLDKGKVANVVVWSGDPFELSTQVEHVYIQGHEASLDNRQHRLMEKYRKLQRRGEPADPAKGLEPEPKPARKGPAPTTLEPIIK